ncbi:unnamed protein product [Effrenium voratum]|nr:unnamed protein product [Effrenium voratum]
MRKMDYAVVRPNDFTYSTAISACERCSQWQQALQLLDNDPNLVTVNAAISACEKAGQWRKVLRLLEELPGRSLRADEISYNAALSALEKGGQWQRALQLLELVENQKMELCVISYSAAISACEKRGEWRVALQLLEEMLTRQLRADVIACSAVISACEKRSHWQQAVFLLQEMIESRLQTDVVSFNAAISACEKAAWPLALQLFAAMPRCRLLAEVMSFSSAISACDKAKRWVDALGLLEACERPNLVSYNAALAACAGQWQHAVSRLLRLQADGFQGDMITLDLLCGIFEEAELGLALRGALHQVDAVGMSSARIAKSFAAPPLLGLPSEWQVPSISSCCRAISLCRRSEDWQGAIALVSEAQDAGGLGGGAIVASAGVSACGPRWRAALALAEPWQADVVVCNGVMSACHKGAQWHAALDIFHHLGANRLEPTVVTRGAAMSAASRGSLWPCALSLFDAGSLVAWGAALSACEAARDWRRGLKMLRSLQALELLGASGSRSAVSFGAAIAACEKASAWQEALQLLSELGQDLVASSAAISACAKSQESGSKPCSCLRRQPVLASWT